MLTRELSLQIAENIVRELIGLEANFESELPQDGLGQETLKCIIADIIDATEEDRYEVDIFTTTDDFENDL